MIRREIKNLCSSDYDSILRDTVQAVKQFNWEHCHVGTTQQTPHSHDSAEPINQKAC